MSGHVDINFDDMFELRMATNTREHKYELFKKRNTLSAITLTLTLVQ